MVDPFKYDVFLSHSSRGQGRGGRGGKPAEVGRGAGVV